MLGGQRLWVVSGKGGVGKSTVAAALALASARAGLRTLVCEVNAPERITQLLGAPAVGPELKQVEDRLWCVDVRPEEAMREYGMMILKLKSVYSAVFENRLVRYFLKFVPSLQELVILGKILFHLREKSGSAWRFDRVIIDAPATGHAITFLGGPQALLDTVPTGPLRKEAEVMRDLLVDPTVTAGVLVSLPEELPINETLELQSALSRKVHLNTRSVVLNMAQQDRFTPAELNALTAEPSLRDVARQQAEQARLTREATARLEHELGLPVTALPRLFMPHHRRAAIEALAPHLAALVGAPA